MKRKHFLPAVFILLCGCRTHSHVTENKETIPAAVISASECDTSNPHERQFNIPIRVLDNSLGYARVRCYPHFDANDTSNMIAKIKCGTGLMGKIPDRKKYYDRPCCYEIIVKDSSGKERIGFISCLVAKPLEEIKKDSLAAIEQRRADSLCDITIHKLPEEDWDGHIKEITYRGVYTGKSLYISNPWNCRAGYCITSCKMNGNYVCNDDLYEAEGLHKPSSEYYYRDYRSVVYVDNVYGLNTGDSVEVEIKYSSYGTPKLLNPEALVPK